MKKEIEALKSKLETLGYKEVSFESMDIEDGSIYFNVINYLEGEEASVRVDIDSEHQVGYDDWLIYESCEKYEWWIVK